MYNNAIDIYKKGRGVKREARNKGQGKTWKGKKKDKVR